LGVEQTLGVIPLPQRIHVQERGLKVGDPRHGIFTDELRPDCFCQST